MKKWYLLFLCKMLVNGALKSIGLKPRKTKRPIAGKFNLGELMRNPDVPIFHTMDEYETFNKETDGEHIFIGNGIYRFYAYSKETRDPREPREPSISKAFDGFIKVVEYCAERMLTAATVFSMHTDKNYRDVKGVMTEEDYKNWSNLRKLHEKKVKLRLENYLNGLIFRFINWQILKLTQSV